MMWFFGDAVQDITVEIDLDRLSREHGYNYIHDAIRLVEQGVEIKQGLWLKTQTGLHTFAVEINLTDAVRSEDNFYLLKPGAKYTLQSEICGSFDDVNNSNLFVPCEDLSWGGGGINSVIFARAIAPHPKVVPLRYTDIAMTRSLPKVLLEFEKVREDLDKGQEFDGENKKSAAVLLNDLYAANPSLAESLTARIATTAANYAGDRSIEVYLASLPVEPLLYRPANPRFRRNWVISGIRAAGREVGNKIIFRGKNSAETNQATITNLFEPRQDDVGAIILNSIKDEALFKAAYSLYKKAYEKDQNVLGLMAMTEPMQRFTEWLKEDRDHGHFPPFILVFNEVEAYKFARQFSDGVEPFMSDDNDFPNIRKFGKLAEVLVQQFSPSMVPRIYVTLGPRGSLGIDGIGPVVYVGCYTAGWSIYDTNACGDAYFTTIALLEWAKRNGHQNIAELDLVDPLASANEMTYFMAVATAVSYCKATNRRGRVYATEVKDLLDHEHLASEILPGAFNLAKAKREQLPHSVQHDYRITEPDRAELRKVKDALASIMRSEIAD